MTPFFLSRRIVGLFVFASLLVLILGFDFRPIHAQQTLTLLPATLPDGMVGVNYHELLRASIGGEPTGASMILMDGALPPGFVLGGNVYLSSIFHGTASEPGGYRFTIGILPPWVGLDLNQPLLARHPYTLVIRPYFQPTIQFVSELLPVATQSSYYSHNISVSGGAPPYTFSVIEGALPDGIQLTSTGMLTGIPTVVGTSIFKVSVRDSVGNETTWTYVFSTDPPASGGFSIEAIHGWSLPWGYTGDTIDINYRAIGGTPPYRFEIVGGVYPPGVVLRDDSLPNGVQLWGRAQTPGEYYLLLRARDNEGRVTTRQFTLTVIPYVPYAPGAGLTISHNTLPSGVVGQAYSGIVTANGGTPPYRYMVSLTGTLPRGLILDPFSGFIGGTPLQPSSPYGCTWIDVVDAVGTRSGACIPLRVTSLGLQLDAATLPAATVGTLYDQRLTATGGVAPHYFSAAAGGVPLGLTVRYDGRIEGVPSQSGTYRFRIWIVSADNIEVEGMVTIVVNPSSITLSPTQLLMATVSVPYSQSITATGGTPPYTFAVTGGALPAGLSLNPSSAVLSGTPTQFGEFTFTITAVDALGLSGSYSYRLIIAPPLSLPPPIYTEYLNLYSFNYPYMATGGVPPYEYRFVRGTVPYFSTLHAYALDGICYPVGNYSFTVEVTDAVGATAMQTYTFSCVDVPAAATATPIPILTFPSPQLPIANVGVPYQALLAVQGGAPPYNFVFLNGTLPPTFGIDGATGLVSGTALDIGSYTFSVQAIDSTGNSGSGTFTLTVAPPDALGGH